MAAFIGVTLWASVLLGLAAIVFAIARPDRRRVALLVAAAALLPIGVLGILTIGWVFLVAAAVCLTSAFVSPPGSSDTAG